MPCNGFVVTEKKHFIKQISEAIGDVEQTKNTTALSALTSGQVHREAKWAKWSLIAGSMAESLTMSAQWGHPCPDFDWMLLLGAQLGVYITTDQPSRKCQSPPGSPPPSIQWNLSVTTNSIIKFITRDLVSNVFSWRLKLTIYTC